MRHGKKFNHLSRKSAHRKSLLRNLAKSLILNKRIVTTLPKAKALVRFVEPIITRSKTNTTHARRVVFSYFQDKEPVKELYNNIADVIGDRPGGYTRIIKLSDKRPGDNAEMCIIELVDFNSLSTKKTKTAAQKTRRSRGKKKTVGKSNSKEKNATDVSKNEDTSASRSKEEVEVSDSTKSESASKSIDEDVKSKDVEDMEKTSSDSVDSKTTTNDVSTEKK